MREMDDNFHSKSDNFDTQRLSIKVTLRVVSTVYPRDRTVTHLLHNKQNTDELTGNFAIHEMDLNHFAPLIMQRHYNGLLTRCENVIFCFSETVAPITRLAIEPAADTLTQLDDLPIDMLFDAISDMMPTKHEKGITPACPSRTSLTSSSATNRCSPPPTSS